MSRFQERVLECPVCSAEFPAKIWSSVNVTLDRHLKEEVTEGRLNRAECSSCGYSGRSLDPFLYHDMDKDLMFYVAEGADPDELRGMVQQIQHEYADGNMPVPATYVLDDTEALITLIDQLENLQNEDGSTIEDASPDEWKEFVDILIAPTHPWPLDHLCICGERIRTLCFCRKDGVLINLDGMDLDEGVAAECPECGRGMVAFCCESCNRRYSWLEEVVDGL